MAMPRRRDVRPISTAHAALGRAAKELRLEAGLTQEQLAERIQSDFSTVGYLERGDSNPSFSWPMRIVEGLDVDLAELIERFERINHPDRRQ